MDVGEFDSTRFPIFLKKMNKKIIESKINVVQQDYLSFPLPRGYKTLSDENIQNKSKDVSLFNFFFI